MVTAQDDASTVMDAGPLPTETAEPVKRVPLIPLIGALWLSETIAAFGSSMTYAATRSLIAAFGDPVSIGWLVTLFLLVGAAATPIAARFGDMFGRKRVLLVVLGIGGLGLAIGAATDSYPLVLLGRALQGLHLAAMALSFGILRECVSPARLPLSIGIVLSAVASGTLSAMLLGGWAADLYGWRAVFALGVIGTALAWSALALFVPASPGGKDSGPVDMISIWLSVPSTAGTLFVVSNLRNWGWTNPALMGILAGSILLALLWVRHSLRTPQPLIDLRLFARKQVLIINVVYICASFGAFQVILLMSMLMQTPTFTGVGLGVSAKAAGLAIIPAAILSLAAAPLGGMLVQRIGGRAVMILSGLVMTAGFLFTARWHDSLAIVTFGFSFITIGTTMLYAAGPPILIAAVPTNRTSEALGMMTVLRALATAAGAQMVAVLLASDTVSRPSDPTTHFPSAAAFSLTFLVIIALSGLTTMLAYAIARKGDDDRIAEGRRQPPVAVDHALSLDSIKERKR
ncbi:MAG: MFS transporter [Novosphingobium sp.]